MVWRTNLEAAVQENLGTSLKGGAFRSTRRRRTSDAAPPPDAIDTRDGVWDRSAVCRVLAGAGITASDEDVRLLLLALHAIDPFLADVRRVAALGEELKLFTPGWE